MYKWRTEKKCQDYSLISGSSNGRVEVSITEMGEQRKEQAGLGEWVQSGHAKFEIPARRQVGMSHCVSHDSLGLRREVEAAVKYWGKWANSSTKILLAVSCFFGLFIYCSMGILKCFRFLTTKNSLKRMIMYRLCKRVGFVLFRVPQRVLVNYFQYSHSQCKSFTQEKPNTISIIFPWVVFDTQFIFLGSSASF